MHKIWFCIAPLLVGCSSLGYFDNSDFIDAINAKPRQCKEAYKMLANTFASRLDEVTHRGLWELKCGDRYKGEALLTQAATAGDQYAKRILVNNGIALPDPEILYPEGTPTININVR